MPSQRLAEKPVPMQRFDVVREDSDSRPGFVRHVGLAVEAKKGLVSGDCVAVCHMGPPLENPGSMPAHCCGSAALTVDEANRVKLYLDEIDAEYAAAPQRPSRLTQYVVHPHVKPWLAKDGTVQWLRFSCVGLAVESYREADIPLVAEESLEPVAAETLDAAYPDLAPIQDRSPVLREDLGIPGEGPWPVMLPGYVLHALDRDAREIRRTPYKPTAAEAFFP